MYCLVPKGMVAKPDSTPESSPQCKRCGTAMQSTYSILNPTSGNHFRGFKCKCGERTFRSYEMSGPRDV